MLSWIACKARTGEVIAELPDLDCQSVSVLMGQYQTSTTSLPLPTAPPEWQRCTLEMGTFHVLVDDDGTGSPVGVWGGLVTSSTRSHGDKVEMSVASIEAYFDRRFVGDKTYTGWDQCALMADLVTSFAGDSLPIRVTYTPSATTRDRTYTDVSDKSLYSVLQELSAVQGGPEWSVSWERTFAPTARWTPVITIADRIGRPVTTGLSPAVTFEMPGGGVTEVAYVTDYRAGKGATDVMAVSTATANTRPQSPHQTSVDAERLKVEYRFTPSTSITQTATLTDHAVQALAYMKDGSVSVALSGIVTDLPRLGSEWFLGDDVGYRIGGLAPDATTYTFPDAYIDTYTDLYGAQGTGLLYPNGRDTVPAFPGGLAGMARVIGWDLTLGNTPTVTPVLVSTTP